MAVLASQRLKDRCVWVKGRGGVCGTSVEVWKAAATASGLR
jgi:hypothetical protein